MMMNSPELTGQAKEEWDKLERLVEKDIDSQLELHREERSKVNAWRARNGLPQI